MYFQKHIYAQVIEISSSPEVHFHNVFYLIQDIISIIINNVKLLIRHFTPLKKSLLKPGVHFVLEE